MDHRFAVVVILLCVTYSVLGDVSSDIGYLSVKEARKSLANDPSATADVDEDSGWLLYTLSDGDHLEIWTFPSAESPVYPAAIRQVIVETEDSFDIQLYILCEASEQQCAQLEKEYIEFNSEVIESASNR